jgi:hypothetical protein
MFCRDSEQVGNQAQLVTGRIAAGTSVAGKFSSVLQQPMMPFEIPIFLNILLFLLM